MSVRRMYSPSADLLQGDHKYVFNGAVEQFQTFEVWASTLISSSLYDPSDPTASVTENGQHKPALDLDIPAAIVRSPTGTQLWVSVETGRLRYRKVLHTVAALGLCSPDRPELKSSWSGLARHRRQDAYSLVQNETVSFAETVETLKVLSAEAKTSFEDVLEAAVTLVPPSTAPSPVMTSPWVIPLDVPVFQAPSSNEGHSHLYLDHALDWKTYLKFLKALASARIVEPKYVSASVARKMTCLRRPGVVKLTPEELDAETPSPLEP